MAIKAHAVGNTRQPNGYPRMMINKAGVVVLFHERDQGMVMFPETGAKPGAYGSLGYYSTTWDMDRFEPWAGVVKIEQD